MNPHLDEDRCLDLLLGLLPESMAEQLLRHIEECPACEDLMRIRAADVERLRSIPVPPILLVSPPERGRILRSLPGFHSGRFRRPMVILPAAGLAVAAALILLLSRGGPAPSIPEIADAGFRFPRAASVLIHRGSGDGADLERIGKGLAAYDRGDFEHAAAALQCRASDARLDLLRGLYHAGALIHLGDAAGAAGILRRLPAAELPEPWRTESFYAFHAALTILGRGESADSLLKVHGLPADRTLPR